MSDTPAKNINYFGQLFLLIFATICCILGFSPLLGASMFLMFLLPTLSVWQIADFGMLWSKNGYKKWYSFYIMAMLIFLLLVLLGYYFSDDHNIVNFRTILGFCCYNIVVAWIYLFYWRKK